MSAGGDTGGADDGSKAIRRPRHPTMIPIASRDYRRNREDASGVAGWKTAAFEGRLATGKKCVVKIRPWRNIGGTFAAGDGFHGKIDDRAIGIGLPSKQGRAHLIG